MIGVTADAAGVFDTTKLQNLKAIPNWISSYFLDEYGVRHHKITKFESNSQLWKRFYLYYLRVFDTTKLQNLKAIPNSRPQSRCHRHGVRHHKITKFESNSQRAQAGADGHHRCSTPQNYKIWKQFPTKRGWNRWCRSVFDTTKLQNLKAIPNKEEMTFKEIKGVRHHKITKFESNSQQLVSVCRLQRWVFDTTKLQNLKAIPNEGCRPPEQSCGCSTPQNYKIWKQFPTQGAGRRHREEGVRHHKITKFESNSQQLVGRKNGENRCSTPQNYKIWKQFPTAASYISMKRWVFDTTKLQNLKAIPNNEFMHDGSVSGVRHHKITKFESNSQQVFNEYTQELGCSTPQNYKIWKQFPTTKDKLLFNVGCSTPQNYKIWKQFPTSTSKNSAECLVFDTTKLQNLKAIPNRYVDWITIVSGVRHHKITKFESNSQRGVFLCGGKSGVRHHKITKFESNSQRELCTPLTTVRCSTPQNYKIWKQFPTQNDKLYRAAAVFDTTKLQNLKAIPNERPVYADRARGVRHHKITKFESNSQRS